MDTLNLIRRIEIINQLANYRKPKIYKKRIDPFSITENQFKQKYRFNKQTARKIIGLIRKDISLDRRGCGTSPELQVLVALSCWGRRGCQDNAGDLHGLAQSTVSRICAKVARALAKHEKEVIKMPTSIEEEVKIARQFKEIRKFPGIIGAVGNTHIKIKKIGEDIPHCYVNKGGFYFLNVQVVCDAQFKILDIMAKWKTSANDCQIFDESSIKERFEKGEFKGRLLGDSSYKLTPYLFTPLPKPHNEKEINYNAAHVATQNPVDRFFSAWKKRFQSLLNGMTVSFSNAKAVTVALAVLHNIAVEEKDDAPDNYNSDEEMVIEMPDNDALAQVSSTTKESIILQSFVEKYF